MAIIKAELSKDIRDKRQKSEQHHTIKKKKKKKKKKNDYPHLNSLNGTEWQVRALRFGTQ